MPIQQVDATLQVEQPDTTLDPLKVAADIGSPTGVALPVLDADARAALAALLAAVAGGLAVSGEVSLDAATLAALETINAAITNFPSDYPDSGSQTLLAAVLAALGSLTVTVNEPVTVDGTVSVGNLPADYPDSAAQTLLTTIAAVLAGTLNVAGTIGLDAPTLAALETINAIVSGTVDVGNFPTEYPLPAGQVTTLTPQTDSLTDAQLRAAPVSVTFPADESGLTDLELRASPVAVSGPLTDAELRAASVPVVDDCVDFEAVHLTLTGGTDTTVNFAQPVRIVRLVNWSTTQRILAKNGTITSDVDSTATRVGKAPATDVPGTRTLPFTTSSIHLRAAADAEVSVEGFV